MGYGAIGNAGFRYYKRDIAEGITATGQLAIKYISKRLNEYLNEYFDTNDIEYVIYCDTDSVVGDTLIYANGSKIKIEDFYNQYAGNYIKNDIDNDNYINELNDIVYTKSYRDNALIDGKIEYVMKHKVKKEMFELTVDDKKVIVTSDHSLIVERDNKIISIKPKEVLESDIFITIKD